MIVFFLIVLLLR